MLSQRQSQGSRPCCLPLWPPESVTLALTRAPHRPSSRPGTKSRAAVCEVEGDTLRLAKEWGHRRFPLGVGPPLGGKLRWGQPRVGVLGAVGLGAAPSSFLRGGEAGPLGWAPASIRRNPWAKPRGRKLGGCLWGLDLLIRVECWFGTGNSTREVGRRETSEGRLPAEGARFLTSSGASSGRRATCLLHPSAGTQQELPGCSVKILPRLLRPPPCLSSPPTPR